MSKGAITIPIELNWTEIFEIREWLKRNSNTKDLVKKFEIAADNISRLTQ